MAGARVGQYGMPAQKPKQNVPTGAINTGPDMNAVLNAGGTWRSGSTTPESAYGDAAAGFSPNDAATYSLPISGSRSNAQISASNRLATMLGGLSNQGYSQNFTPPQVATPAREQFQGGNIAAPNTDAAQNAEFGAAKAKAGAMGRSSLDSLRASLAESGMLGGGTEARGLVDRLAAATNPLSDLNVAQLHENVGITQHNQDLQNQNAGTAFQGGIAQRGQDIGTATTNANFQADAQKQRRDAMQQQLQMALQGLRLAY